VLHTDDYICGDSSVPVPDGLALTATREVLEAMSDPQASPRRALLALGYAGWDAGQLEQEIRDNVWLTCEPNEALLFGRDYDHKWSLALSRLGVSADRLSSAAGRA
jgi:putative transcriptional regulator